MYLEDSEPANTVELSLCSADALNRSLEVEPAIDTCGGEPDIENDGVQIRIGSRPQALDLRRLYEQTGRTIPPEYEATFDGFRLWLVSYAMSVLSEGRKRVESLNFDVTLAEKPRVTVADLFPKPQFHDRLTLRAETNADLSAGIDLAGRFGMPPEWTELLDQTDYFAAGGSASTTLKLGGKVGLVGRVGLFISTPVVESMGRGDTWSRWAFHRDRTPLLNDFVMMHTLVVPKVVSRLLITAVCGATITTFGFLPSKRVSKPISLECKLPRVTRTQT